MARERTGSVVRREKKLANGKKQVTWWARVTYVDPVTGQRHDRQRRAENKADAKELIHDLLTELDTTEGRTLTHERKTFLDLADYFSTHYLKPAEYVDGRKVAGVRSLMTLKGQLETLKTYFGKRRIRSLTHGDLRTFRADRLKTPTRVDIARHERELKTNSEAELRSTRTIASVNRELALLRRMFNVAEREGWIVRSPFKVGESLISLADERRRERILTRDEEARLLNACADQRAHLRPIIICALDTGMRRGEILQLRWRDVDFKNGVITVQAFNTKTMRERQLSMTTRLVIELEKLYEQSPKHAEGLVFGIRDNVKRSFGSVRDAAGLKGVRFHDLRHTAATRLVGAHIPLSEVGRVLGHTQPATTYRYTNANIETARRAAAALDAFNGEGETEETSAEVVH